MNNNDYVGIDSSEKREQNIDYVDLDNMTLPNQTNLYAEVGPEVQRIESTVDYVDLPTIATDDVAKQYMPEKKSSDDDSMGMEYTFDDMTKEQLEQLKTELINSYGYDSTNSNGMGR